MNDERPLAGGRPTELHAAAIVTEGGDGGPNRLALGYLDGWLRAEEELERVRAVGLELLVAFGLYREQDLRAFAREAIAARSSREAAW